MLKYASKIYRPPFLLILNCCNLQDSYLYFYFYISRFYLAHAVFILLQTSWMKNLLTLFFCSSSLWKLIQLHEWLLRLHYVSNFMAEAKRLLEIMNDEFRKVGGKRYSLLCFASKQMKKVISFFNPYFSFSRYTHGLNHSNMLKRQSDNTQFKTFLKSKEGS